ncbi:MAG: CrcB family protein [Halobacteriaceae archaeon]
MIGDRLGRTLALAALVAVGGFAGATLRYLVAIPVPGLAGTLLANAAGSTALGALFYESVYAGGLSREARLAAGSGFLSSFTTYSTFVLQSATAPGPLLTVANVVATYGFGFAGVLVGRVVAGLLTGARAGGDPP